MSVDRAGAQSAALTLPTRQELESVFLQKHGSPEMIGWAPRRRFEHGYYLPSDVYEALVSKLVFPGCAWIDVGGGHAIFPENAALARALVDRCARVVAVDPSENVKQNRFVHEGVPSSLEEYDSDLQFDVATMRMVVEHVRCPERFVSALARLVRPGGVAVVFTVNRHTPIALLSWLLPFRLHYGIKRIFWGGEDKDTFPVHYLMNTRSALRRFFDRFGFTEAMFAKLDDLSTFGRFQWLNYLELWTWRLLRGLGMAYPENCLLAVYRRNAAVE